MCNDNFSAVLCGHETLSLTVREGNGLRTFENGVVRKIFCYKMEKVTGGRLQLHKEEHYDLYFSQAINKVIKSKRVS